MVKHLPRAGSAAAAIVLSISVVGGLAWRRTPKRVARTPGLELVSAGRGDGGRRGRLGRTKWLLSEANDATDRGAARVDAIKTGLGIGAGTTAIFALLLAVRRQTHQERTAADTSVDAAAKRVTELYTKAGAPRGASSYPRRSREELKGGSWA